jgi:hypothetical protein
MADYKALLAELRTLERIQADLTQLAGRQDNARKAETVELRRQLAHQIGVLSELGRLTLNAPSDQDVYTDFRTRLSAMRSAIALHQAEWPAVALDTAPEEYLRSAQRVLKAKEAFTPWAIRTIGILARSGA